MGGLFGGSSSTAFGSRSGNILTRITTVLGALFLIISLGLALMNRSTAGDGVERAAQSVAPNFETNDWWERDNTPSDFVPEGNGD